MAKHPHFEVMMEWAADTSKVVQVYSQMTNYWFDCNDLQFLPDRQYRIRPEKKPDHTTECNVSVQQEPTCNFHPKAPHGFDRDRSHSAGRYVCDCEGWDAYEAGYQAGIESALSGDEPALVQQETNKGGATC